MPKTFMRMKVKGSEFPLMLSLSNHEDIEAPLYWTDHAAH